MTVTAGPDLAVMDPVTWTLDNGLRVIVQVDARLPLAAVNIRYEVGSRHEADGQHGFAHLIEHLMFEGTARRPAGRHQALLQAAGGSRINATTNQDRSNFFQTIPTRPVFADSAQAGPLELALDLEAERMARLAEALTDDKVERQRRVVASERLQIYDTPPYGRFPELLLARAYPPGHPYQHLTIGSPADLRRARAGDLARFHRCYYGPNNAVLAVVGDVEPAEVRRLTETYFGPVPPRPVPAGSATHVDHQIGGDLAVAGPAPAPKVYFAFRTAPFGSAEHDAVTLLAAIVGLGRGSLLYQCFAGSADLVASEEMASAWTFSAGSSLLVGDASGRPGVSARHIAERITDALARVGEAITDRELERAKALVVTSWLRQLASLGGRADALTEYAATFGDPAFATGHLDRLAAVRSDEVRAAAHQVLRPDNQLVLRFGDQEPAGRVPAGQESGVREPGCQESPC